jgi:site-specific recombinase XerD
MQGITVYQRPGRKTFYVIYPDPNTGERVFKSSGIPLSDPQGRMKAYAFARQKSQSGIGARCARDHEQWDVWVPFFLRTRFAKSPKTLTSYIGAWKFLSAFLHEHEVKSARQLTYQHALDFAAWREAKKKKASGKFVSRNTTLHNIKVMSRIMREAVRRDFAPGNPWYKVTDDLPADAVPEKPEYTDEDVAKVRAELERRAQLGRPSDWMPIAFEIALAQGCRLSATEIPMHQIAFERWTIRFAEKGGQDFTVPVNPTIRPLLQRLRDEGRDVTCKLPRFASRIFSRVLKTAGLQAPAGMGNHTFHSTRVTVISRGARAGIPEQKMMRVVHHGSWAVHKRYTKLRAADVSDVYPALGMPPPTSSLLERHGDAAPGAPGIPARVPA